MALTIEEVSSKLCYYDKRNSEGVNDQEIIQSHLDALKKNNTTCSCDNCFYGRTALAEELLKSIPVVNEAGYALSFLADLNGSAWIENESVGGKDMNQRAKALQGSLYKVLNPQQ